MDATRLMFKPGLMQGERILITGGGTGLGREMAEAFLSLGARVVICGRRGEVLKETAQALTERWGGDVMPIACDIRSAEAVAEMVEDAWASGGLTGLVNNAAGNFISRTEDLSAKGFEAVTSIVFRGSFYVTLEVGKRWIEAKQRGSVLSILATTVWRGSPFMTPSAMSKAGVNVMTQSLAVEWAHHGIRLNAIAPGPFPTPGAGDRLSPAVAGAEGGLNARGNPMGRVGEMHELCNLAVLLMGPGAEYINGQTIAIDGAAFLGGGQMRPELFTWGDEEWAAARQSIRAVNDKDRAQRTT
ncbi:SDR family oxidoreductase [Phenylobacterium sp.]|uniref:SDR family oxidoreductase n=1 Tax=Phenylobacterium sp. TaxID=1871053 RepID=UPI002734020C|nr:SDR family oxidoreductase [Phenylobacterium sp.]MDP3660308.1 SDR family oxidoreductase [Phenylobacterium sp.]